MTSQSSFSPVRDNPQRQRFEMAVEDDIAFITYRRSPGVVNLLHAEVPMRFEGRGYGSALAKGTLDLLRAEGSRVIPSCSFIDAYIRRHPDYRDLL
ncbi:MAG: GNAT family N-acetyltransferase [Steroidobacteraceae bacterium]